MSEKGIGIKNELVDLLEELLDPFLQGKIEELRIKEDIFTVIFSLEVPWEKIVALGIRLTARGYPAISFDVRTCLHTDSGLAERATIMEIRDRDSKRDKKHKIFFTYSEKLVMDIHSEDLDI